MLDAVLALAVILRCEVLADRYITLCSNPPLTDEAPSVEWYGFDRGIVLGELKGLVSLMNELTGTSVDHNSFVDAAWNRSAVEE